MTRTEYDAEAERLLKVFARVHDPNGPAHGHATVEARDAASAIRAFAAKNWDPAWYVPFKR